MKKRSLMTLFCIVLVLAFSLTACTQPSITTQTTQVTTKSTTQKPSETSGTTGKPAEAAKITLFWPYGGVMDPPTSFDSEYSDFLAEKIGVRIAVQPSQTGNAIEALNLARATKSLPDIVYAYISRTDAALWHKEGNTIALDKYFNDAVNYPNLAAVDKAVLAFHKNSDGVLVTFPSASDLPESVSDAKLSEKRLFECTHAFGHFARKDLLEGFGKPIKTLTDMNEYLAYCKDKKAIDGTKVIPLGIPRFSTAPSVEWFFAPFGGRSSYMADASGNIVLMEASKPYYNMMLQMNKWFKAGIIDPEIFTNDFSQYEAKIAAGKFGLFFTSSWAAITYNKTIADPNYSYVPIPWWKAEGVDQFMGEIWGNPSFVYGEAQLIVSSACKDPDAAMRFVDYMSSPEGYLSGHAGEPGVGWEWTNDSHKEFRLKDLGKKLAQDGGNPDWITNAGKYGNFVAYKYGISGNHAIELENVAYDPMFIAAFEARKGQEGHLYGHRMVTIDMITPTEQAALAATDWNTAKGQWMLDIMGASEANFQSVYVNGLLKSKAILKTLEEQTTIAWNDFKTAHSDLKDDPSWYGPVERVVSFN